MNRNRGMLLAVLLLTATPAQATSDLGIFRHCKEYDIAAMAFLHRNRHDPKKIAAVVGSYMAIRGEICPFDGSYKYCAALGNESCVYVKKLRRSE